MPIDTHNLICEFGRAHRGELWTRIPVGYLTWIIREEGIPADVKEIADAELKRRGTTLPTFEISGHAIDRASLSCRAIWHQTAVDKSEGLHSWLIRIGQEALEKGERIKGKTAYLGMLFVFEESGAWPMLKTVMRRNK